MKNQTFLAEKYINAFYNEEYNPTKDNTNDDFLFQYNDLKNNTDNFLFIDGSIVSNGGDYREMSSLILPKQEQLELSLVQSEHNTHELKIIKTKSSENNEDNYTSKTLILSDDECGYVQILNEKGSIESSFLEKEDTLNFIKNEFGLDPEQMILTIKTKNKQTVKQHTGILSFLNKAVTKKDNTKSKTNKPN